MGKLRHGMRQTVEYETWKRMRQRCENRGNPAYKAYGGRGITVCERWQSFANFFADMGPRPHGTSIDRIDNDGNYEPGNCRWATPKEQARNRRPEGKREGRLLVEIGDERRSIAEWAERFGIDRKLVWERLKAGWEPQRALAEPIAFRGQPGRAIPYVPAARPE